MIKNIALVGLSVETLLKFESLKKMVAQLKEIAEIHSASATYKKFWNVRKEDLNSELWTVLKISSSKDAEELLSELKAIEKESKKTALLLSFNDQVVMTPQLTLPHPKLVMESTVLRCAAEVWGDYEHPILRQNLNELVKSQESNELIQFFSQSRMLFL